jgi:hypothetical protein
MIEPFAGVSFEDQPKICALPRKRLASNWLTGATLMHLAADFRHVEHLLRHSLGPGVGRADRVSVYFGQVWASRPRGADWPHEASSMAGASSCTKTAALCGSTPGTDMMHYDTLALTRYTACPLLKEEDTRKLRLINAPLASLLWPNRSSE